ncbi:hypothetical protein [Pseudofrankia sp. DC12]|uniref:hypothetical protein n=1 Tax=Pseudofrankia sp. DC12 TaxID=683315 RepID=UPI000A041B97|nr:hypothetical protein [Pseudofrankia sp. DC12]
MDRRAADQDCRPAEAQAGPSFPPRRIRPYAVLNGYGEQLATFADWSDAHAWAHRAADEPEAILPLEVEDRSQRITRRIGRGTCELIAWTIFTKIGGCEPVEESHPAIYEPGEADPTAATTP